MKGNNPGPYSTFSDTSPEGAGGLAQQVAEVLTVAVIPIDGPPLIARAVM